MGIVNVTPDSFSDGGRFLDPHQAVAHALQLEEDGADLLDLGGESARPGSAPVSAEEELRRIQPVLKALRPSTRLPLSIDTRKAAVAQVALDEGADLVNDVSALADPQMAHVVAEAQAGLVLMHMKGTPQTMQEQPQYEDVVSEVRFFLKESAQNAESQGISRESIAIDPGIGFGKRTGQGIEDNAILLKHLQNFSALGYPVLVGASRKRFIGNLLGLPAEDRLEGSLAAAAVAVANGAAIVRVHDMKATRRVVDFLDAIRRA